MSETLDLFGGDLSPAPSPAPSAPAVLAHAPTSEVHKIGASAHKTPDHLLLAFVAQARHHGHTDPALTPISVDSAGRRLFDEVEVTRFANELLRGVRSDRPAMTPERWSEAARCAAHRTEAIAKTREVRS